MIEFGWAERPTKVGTRTQCLSLHLFRYRSSPVLEYEYKIVKSYEKVDNIDIPNIPIFIPVGAWSD